MPLWKGTFFFLALWNQGPLGSTGGKVGVVHGASLKSRVTFCTWHPWGQLPEPGANHQPVGAGSTFSNEAHEKPKAASLSPSPREYSWGLVLQEGVGEGLGQRWRSGVFHSQARPFDF